MVIGAYGMIGAHVVRDLTMRGHQVICLGRNATTARRVLPDADWIFHDLRDLVDAATWASVVTNHSHVVNCAGALQDNGADDLATVHNDAIAALASACTAQGVGLIQISAVGADPGAATAFMDSKAQGDAAIRNSGAAWWIFKPGLVLAPNGYGGTALMRMLAAVPLVQPMTMGDALLQTVSIADVCDAVARAVTGDIPVGTEADLVEDEAHRLQDLVAAFRNWLGFPAARATLRLPAALIRPVGWVADGLGRLGWRSPLRSTALRVTQAGVGGDAMQTRAVLGRPAHPLKHTLAAMPARAEDRLAARMALLMPVVVAVLSLFWIASGVIGLARLGEAAQLLQDQGWGTGRAQVSVASWAVVDIALGLAILVRRWARPATLAMAGVCAVYLISASVVTPTLWLDPLGPLVKILPAAMLALVARPLLEPR
nr:SDR family oxidoreductase [Aliiroseovarius subalbicans]